MFANETSLFSKVKEKTCFAIELNNDLKTTSKWVIQWKMLIPTLIKQILRSQCTFKIKFSELCIKLNFGKIRENKSNRNIIFFSIVKAQL